MMSQTVATPTKLELLGTQGCHLCEVAERLVRRVAPQANVRIEYVDIADDPALVDEFGMAIPVMRLANSATAGTLGWPFSEEEFIVWAKSVGQN